MKNDLSTKPLLVVDLNSGKYWNEKIGHECYNLERNDDGNFYGYCPPNDVIDITKPKAKKDDEFVDGVTVVYVTKTKGSSDREIIAFCENSRVYHYGRSGIGLNRNIPETGEDCSYSIVSNNLTDLRTYKKKFIIKIADYNTSMFRMQRFFNGTYPKLDKKIFLYLNSVLEIQEQEDDLTYQNEIQNANFSEIKDNSRTKPEYTFGSGSQAVKKNAKVAKSAIAKAGYKCAIDVLHKTFDTNKGVPYMEGHHLIPCTYSNAKFYWEKHGINIDCENNIVSLCPTCHRQIHFGSKEEKKIIIQKLYKIKAQKLEEVGINLSLNDLMDLYDI